LLVPHCPTTGLLSTNPWVGMQLATFRSYPLWTSYSPFYDLQIFLCLILYTRYLDGFWVVGLHFFTYFGGHCGTYSTQKSTGCGFLFILWFYFIAPQRSHVRRSPASSSRTGRLQTRRWRSRGASCSSTTGRGAVCGWYAPPYLSIHSSPCCWQAPLPFRGGGGDSGPPT
jgi:hypothetical protein